MLNKHRAVLRKARGPGHVPEPSTRSMMKYVTTAEGSRRKKLVQKF